MNKLLLICLLTLGLTSTQLQIGPTNRIQQKPSATFQPLQQSALLYLQFKLDQNGETHDARYILQHPDPQSVAIPVTVDLQVSNDLHWSAGNKMLTYVGGTGPMMLYGFGENSRRYAILTFPEKLQEIDAPHIGYEEPTWDSQGQHV